MKENTTKVIQRPAAPQCESPERVVVSTKQPPVLNSGVLHRLSNALEELKLTLFQEEEARQETFTQVGPEFLPSARNLAHYLALRRVDLRGLQQRLTAVGLSSLGHIEGHVLAHFDLLTHLLDQLLDIDAAHPADVPGLSASESAELLAARTLALLGEVPRGRDVRIMVTLPPEAADDYALVRKLVAAGMDIARINCAHDDPAAWKKMCHHLHRAAKGRERPVRILMDLGGPKLRTCGLSSADAVLKIKPERDAYGQVTAPGRVVLQAPVDGPVSTTDQPQLRVAAEWLAQIKPGDELIIHDARDARRTLYVVEATGNTAVVEMRKTAYFTNDVRIKRRGHGSKLGETKVNLAACPAEITVQVGDRLHLIDPDNPLPQEQRKTVDSEAKVVGCTLPIVLQQVSVDDPVWFDDGKIGAIVRHQSANALELEVIYTPPNGAKLANDKGINFPSSRLDLPALTETDIEHLETVRHHADMVGLSFVQDPKDVVALRHRLDQLDAQRIGIVLKIETKRAFDNLPELLFAAMTGPGAAVMIARGDLAIECGYERLAEVQEEIMWAAEAAHMPVIWATQVLESLVKKGQPSRAEITDAAMGQRTECVMLNKGPYIVEAIGTLDDILCRMRAHQDKKRALLRALKAWDNEAAA